MNKTYTLSLEELKELIGNSDNYLSAEAAIGYALIALRVMNCNIPVKDFIKTIKVQLATKEAEEAELYVYSTMFENYKFKQEELKDLIGKSSDNLTTEAAIGYALIALNKMNYKISIKEFIKTIKVQFATEDSDEAELYVYTAMVESYKSSLEERKCQSIKK